MTGPRTFVPFMLLAALAGAQRSADLTRYHEAVDAYRAGAAIDDPRVAPFTRTATVAAQAVDAPTGWTAADFAGAAMLHTDVALRLVKAARPDDARAHLDAATNLLRIAADREPARAAFARRWRSTVAGLLHAFGARDSASELRYDGLPWLTDSKKQLQAAKSFEWGLASEIRAAVAGPLSGALPKKTQPVPAEALAELRTAARDFESALAADPACGEALLHLGRIRLLDGRDADAERTLRAAAAADSVPVRYLATLWLGALAERQSRYADAEAQYRAASDVFPWGQSAPLALSHVLMRAGREADAREVLAAHFERTRGRVVEPLRTYLSDPETDLGPALDLLRAEVWSR
jgi:hypothetical protein